MSRLCSATRWPAIRRSDAIAASPPTTSEMSVEVPPMSNGMRSPWPRSRAAYWLPATPPAGPESTPPAASRTASAMVATPPCDWMISTGARNPASRSRVSEAGQVALQRRADVGVDDGGADALVLLDLRQHLRRERDVDARHGGAHGLGRRPLVGSRRASCAGSRSRPPRRPGASGPRWRRRASRGRARSRPGRRGACARARRAGVRAAPAGSGGGWRRL